MMGLPFFLHCHKALLQRFPVFIQLLKQRFLMGLCLRGKIFRNISQLFLESFILSGQIFPLLFLLIRKVYHFFQQVVPGRAEKRILLFQLSPDFLHFFRKLLPVSFCSILGHGHEDVQLFRQSVHFLTGGFVSCLEVFFHIIDGFVDYFFYFLWGRAEEIFDGAAHGDPPFISMYPGSSWEPRSAPDLCGKRRSGSWHQRRPGDLRGLFRAVFSFLLLPEGAAGHADSAR